MRKAVVEKTIGKVINVIEIEPGANWAPPDGCYLVDAKENGSPGDTWDGDKFVTPIITPQPVRDLATEIDELKARLDNLERKDILAS